MFRIVHVHERKLETCLSYELLINAANEANEPAKLTINLRSQNEKPICCHLYLVWFERWFWGELLTYWTSLFSDLLWIISFEIVHSNWSHIIEIGVIVRAVCSASMFPRLEIVIPNPYSVALQWFLTNMIVFGMVQKCLYHPQSLPHIGSAASSQYMVRLVCSILSAS